jgi:glycosyltransferase involved in cell wall biosynthesis
MVVKVIIPAFNEEDAIAYVIRDIPRLVAEVVVVSNGSTDQTEEKALQAGATVLVENRKGYGYACLKGIDHIARQEKKTDIVVFLDGDYSDHPEELEKIIEPILKEDMDMVIGARVATLREAGSMTIPQKFGNWLATSLMWLFFKAHYTDLGPFRAIKMDKLQGLEMEDKTYGWTVEMQLKAHRQGLRYCEVPVRYRNRIGVSKVSGTVKGAIFAGVKILGWIFKYSVKR